VERGDIILIGATTENPSFEVISALLSRSRVYALRALTVPEIVTLLRRALPVVGTGSASDDLLEQIAIYSNGDARRRTTRWKRRGGSVRRRSPSRRVRTPCSARCCSTTRAARSTST
jgi:replication-associated recombination protein RarA